MSDPSTPAWRLVSYIETLDDFELSDEPMPDQASGETTVWRRDRGPAAAKQIIQPGHS